MNHRRKSGFGDELVRPGQRLERREYFEAISAASTLPAKPTATDEATVSAVPIQTAIH